MPLACPEPSMMIEILKVLPTAIVGAIAAYIAWRQAKIAGEQRAVASAKLNLDLFDRRLAVFDAAWETASKAIQSAPELVPYKMTNMLPQASFLFGPEIESYLKELSEKITRLAMINQMTKQNGDVVPADKLKDLNELESWVFQAATSGIRNIFAPYLNFAQWR